MQITNIRNKTWDITTDPTDIKKIIKECCEQLCKQIFFQASANDSKMYTEMQETKMAKITLRKNKIGAHYLISRLIIKLQ